MIAIRNTVAEVAPRQETVSAHTTEEVELGVERKSRKEVAALETGEMTRPRPKRWKAKLTKTKL